MATGDVELVKSALAYDPETGILTWKVSSGSAKQGDIAASVDCHGYSKVKIKGRHFYAHRAAWIVYYGKEPIGHLDHANGIKTDNRIRNLREATRAQNQMNRSSCTSHKGVTWNKARGKWSARCAANGHRHHIGYFNDINQAVAAYRMKASELHGEFFKE